MTGIERPQDVHKEMIRWNILNNEHFRRNESFALLFHANEKAVPLIDASYELLSIIAILVR